MGKIDYKKNYRGIYFPKNVPTIVDIPEMSYITIEGAGNPGGEEFKKSVEVLYALSYAVKMSYKSDDVPEGYQEYTVFPLEGIWDLVDYTKPVTDKDNYKYKLMIRQPDFLTEELFNRFKAQVEKKKPQLEVSRANLETITEGLSCQIMHIGSYDDEPESFRHMMEFCAQNHYERIGKTHKEIYISDPRLTEAFNQKTVLRFWVKATDGPEAE
ncbi:MAG TPA: GyrI-like domain-containing protein [Clostridiaceae bacterium]|nr:GyrI-like domain-containing protein [Clostridiaceae bacterium]